MVAEWNHGKGFHVSLKTFLKTRAYGTNKLYKLSAASCPQCHNHYPLQQILLMHQIFFKRPVSIDQSVLRSIVASSSFLQFGPMSLLMRTMRTLLSQLNRGAAVGGGGDKKAARPMSTRFWPLFVSSPTFKVLLALLLLQKMPFKDF